MSPSVFEVLLLLNNCEDGSAELAASLQRELRDRLQLHVVAREFAPREAHVGMARRLLMDTAWERLSPRTHGAILSTDADTIVAPDWVRENLRALQRVDVVGGEICWAAGELEHLPPMVRRAYLTDRRLQAMVAEIESLLDPLPEDPWPRHMHAFGASLACTTEAYAAAGGLPILPALEDVEFVARARAVGARVRHAMSVRVYTSSRMHGKVDVGLSGQLREWKAITDAGHEHWVPSAELIVHRALWAGAIRRFAMTGRGDDLKLLPTVCQQEVRLLAEEETRPACVVARCAALIENGFDGERQAEVGEVLRKLTRHLEAMRPGESRSAESAYAAAD